jgi:hypothetical protein
VSGDEYTEQELKRLAWLKLVHAPTSTILREFGRHTESSLDMAWLNVQGKLPNASALMRQVAAELDEDPRFEGWREV